MMGESQLRSAISKFMPAIIGGGLVLLALWFAIGRKPEQVTPPVNFAEQQAAIKAFAASFSSFESIEGPEAVKESSVVFDLEGNKIPLTSFAGKPVVLNFWATWCAPCVAELESLARLKRQRPDIEVIAVSLDMQKTPQELDDFLETANADNLGVYYDQGIELNLQFPTRGLPTTYIISPNGKITFKMEGDTDWVSSETSIFLDTLKSKSDNF